MNRKVLLVFLDVTLIILLVYIINARMGIEVISETLKLPHTSAKPGPNKKGKSITLKITNAGEFFVNGEKTDAKKVGQTLKQDTFEIVYTRIDKRVSWEIVGPVLSSISKEGKVAVVQFREK